MLAFTLEKGHFIYEVQTPSGKYLGRENILVYLDPRWDFFEPFTELRFAHEFIITEIARQRAVKIDQYEKNGVTYIEYRLPEDVALTAYRIVKRAINRGIVISPPAVVLATPEPGSEIPLDGKDRILLSHLYRTGADQYHLINLLDFTDVAIRLKVAGLLEYKDMRYKLTELGVAVAARLVARLEMVNGGKSE